MILLRQGGAIHILAALTIFTENGLRQGGGVIHFLALSPQDTRGWAMPEGKMMGGARSPSLGFWRESFPQGGRSREIDDYARA